MTSALRKDIFKAFLLAAAALLAVPLVAYLFTGYAIPRINPRYSELWQFLLVREVSGWTLAAGVFLMAAVGALGALAFASRGAQYVSFVAGWTLLSFASAAEVLVQGSLMVWLSFWITAFFFHSYFIKLIAIAGLLAAGGMLVVIISIFRRPALSTEVEGELLGEDDAPRLWARIREVARRMRTEPPKQIVAGIDTNFFVTESPMTVSGKPLTGRTLFVSLPLLRVLDRGEADAVLGHELAHFRGGDTASSARLGPRLVQYDQYCAAMHASGITIAVFWVMNLYRLIFELALKRDSREREYKADRTAAKLVSPQAIVHSLIKVAAYANYRSQIEQKLFEQKRQHEGALGIAGQVAQGLAPYAASAHFVDAMESANIPHPFDSHPALRERMKNVKHFVEEGEYTAIVTRPVADSWVHYIATAADIEQRLWSVYEQGFSAMHEQSLAYRYEPANEAERAVVLKYFPPVSVPLKKGEAIGITYEGLELPGGQGRLSWDDVKDLKYEDGYGGDVLEITHPEKGLIGHKTSKVKLPGVKPKRDELKALLGRYWQRHQVMRRQQDEE